MGCVSSKGGVQKVKTLNKTFNEILLRFKIIKFIICIKFLLNTSIFILNSVFYVLYPLLAILQPQTPPEVLQSLVATS